MPSTVSRAPKHGRRSKLDIVGDVLRVVADGAERPTNVMFRANLTWPLTMSYLELLLRHRMMSTLEEGGRQVYRVTPKGSALLRSYIELEEGAAELELDRFDSALVSKVISRPRQTESPEEAAPLRVVQEKMERAGYKSLPPTVRGHSGVEHTFDLLMVSREGAKVGYVVREKAALEDVIRAFILQTDCELQVSVVSRGRPDREAGDLARSYGVELVSREDKVAT